MATTSLSLGEHWEVFIKNEISSGRYGSASEVVRDALRTMEERKSKLEALRAHLAQGAQQAKNGKHRDQQQRTTEHHDSRCFLGAIDRIDVLFQLVDCPGEILGVNRAGR